MNVQEIRRRRRHGAPAEEEDSTKLQFGPDFSFDPANSEDDRGLFALNLSETRLLVQAALKQRRGPGAALENSGDMEEDEEDYGGSNEVLRKSQEYLATFARFRDPQTVNAVEHLLKSVENADLHPFEVAQLGSLAIDDAEEAKTLIPSLAFKKSDEELQVLLDHLRRFG